MSILILGGTSDIAGEIATLTCAGQDVVLAARRPEAVHGLVQQLKERGAAQVHVLHFDATALETHRTLITQAQEKSGEISLAVVAFGILGDQETAESDESHAIEIATVDYTAQISMLTVLAEKLRAQESGSAIVAFSSIAGWRARRANYVYGSTKAGLDAFCQGLADALHGTKVRLIIARPGFVIGSMTEGMSPAPMSVYPHDVAEAVVHAYHTKKSSTTLWIPGRLRVLAWIMRLVPRVIWRKMPR
ncbi:SDR family oxidoreductase [Corynebacterium crudilactis]|uniref:SDR family oxidoreductase n=1 Tax=Corynebacterium crudilactis TaxID=1652495 RepID=A0A172QTK8_9CORY|nr:SDR family oxidoreductase [Corynebacterium crudilactis]ANE04014.1 SDR family oxidoreductase [Corynebacterium crudilactis]